MSGAWLHQVVSRWVQTIADIRSAVPRETQQTTQRRQTTKTRGKVITHADWDRRNAHCQFGLFTRSIPCGLGHEMLTQSMTICPSLSDTATRRQPVIHMDEAHATLVYFTGNFTEGVQYWWLYKHCWRCRQRQVTIVQCCLSSLARSYTARLVCAVSFQHSFIRSFILWADWRHHRSPQLVDSTQLLFLFFRFILQPFHIISAWVHLASAAVCVLCIHFQSFTV